jgi:hypothetical protein
MILNNLRCKLQKIILKFAEIHKRTPFYMAFFACLVSMFKYSKLKVKKARKFIYELFLFHCLFYMLI